MLCFWFMLSPGKKRLFGLIFNMSSYLQPHCWSHSLSLFISQTYCPHSWDFFNLASQNHFGGFSWNASLFRLPMCLKSLHWSLVFVIYPKLSGMLAYLYLNPFPQLEIALKRKLRTFAFSLSYLWLLIWFLLTGACIFRSFFLFQIFRCS